MTKFISLEQFTELVKQECYYCPTKPAFGVDAVDPKFGHTNDNCVPCCWADNHAKSDSTREDYICQCQAVAEKAASKDLK